MFFNGIIPLNTGKVEITAQSLSDPLQQLLGAKDLHQVIYKEVGSLQGIRDTQALQRKLQADVTAQQITLAQQTTTLTQQLVEAQTTDAQNAQRLQAELNTTKQQLTAIQKSLSK
jgi:hypothetical protein